MRSHFFTVLVVFAAIASCTENSDRTEDMSTSISKQQFGTMPDGQVVDQYTLTNHNGIEMKVITYGGIITSLRIPDRNGKLEDVVLGYDNLEGYLEQNPYFGAIIGRYGNRIAKGKFTLDGTEYSLATNNLGNHLHGGIVGFDKVVWEAETVKTDSSAGIKFSYDSPDMEEGYPGNLYVTVIYTLDNDDQLTFEYAAMTDKQTIVNLTNHAYYNLSAMKEDILQHELTLNANRYLPVDSSLIPLEAAPVAGTPFDFTEPKKIGADINDEHVQLKNGGGYDHCWILNASDDEMQFAASLYEPDSGRYMEIYTTEPGIQFYSGNFLDGTITGKNGITYGYRSGLCLETQHFPDSPNRPDFPSVVLNPGERYYSKTITHFSTK